MGWNTARRNPSSSTPYPFHHNTQQHTTPHHQLLPTGHPVYCYTRAVTTTGAGQEDQGKIKEWEKLHMRKQLGWAGDEG
jgi:hypothetical protein